MKRNIETICVQGGWQPKNGEPRVLPIYQSTTYQYDSTEHVGKLFDLAVPGHMYSRISNPTLEAVESKIAELEGGVGAMLTASGQSASMLALLNIMKAGDHFVSMSSLYGGTYNLFNVTMRQMGIDVTFVDQKNLKEIEAAIRPETKAVFGETVANPSLAVLDVEEIAKIAHAKGVPLIVDNTFPTPIMWQPLRSGADIVVHSTTKYLDGHAVAVGGAIVDGGTFDWASSDRFDAFNTPDESYHGLIYTEAFGNLAYITKARVHLMRDIGATMSPFNGFLLNLGLETLALRVERHCENALKVARFLAGHDKIEWVRYPLLPGDTEFRLARKYRLRGAGGVISFGIKGGKEAAARCIDSFRVIKNVVHVADVRSCVLHPATATHRQLSDEQLESAGIKPEMVRLSVGVENVDDIIADIRQALAGLDCSDEG